MLNFTMQQKVKILYGNGAINQLGELVVQTNHKKPMIVCDKGTVAAGIVDKAVNALKKLNIEYVIFDEVVPDPPVHVVETGAEVCKNEQCDMVVGIGGGSSIDTAKAINITRFNEGPITRFADMTVKMNESHGTVAIPTTAGTGSEVSDGIILTDVALNKKFAILAPEGIPEYAIVDPELMASMPPRLTAATGLDVLAHVAEGYTSTLANGYSDLICEKVIEEVVKYLPMAYANGSDLEARGKMAASATLGGWMLVNVHAHLGHAIGHAIGGKFHIQHGYACAYALPYALEYAAPAVPEKIKKLINIFGGTLTGSETPEELGTMVKDLVIDFAQKLGITPQLPEKVDFTFEEVADEIVNEVHQNFSYKKLNKEESVEVLHKIFG